MSDRCRIIVADVLDGLAQIESESIQCVVTSPPYFGLRDYGADGQLGLEKTFPEYLERMVTIFREVRRVMRPDATCWLNMGDSYASGKGTCFNPGGGEHSLGNVTNPGKNKKTVGAYPLDRGNKSTLERVGLKPKDLMLMPHRLAIALCDDGWWVRSDIVWAKPNPMPESVTDRPTRSHEYIFLLSKSANYFYDSEAIREETDEWNAPGQHSRLFFDRDPAHLKNGGKQSKKPDGWDTGNGAHGTVHRNGREAGEPSEIRTGRNKRSVWTIPTEPYAEAHFATFPTALVKPCVLAGTSEKGCCAECGSPWVREVQPGSGLGEPYKRGTRGHPGGGESRMPRGGQKEWNAHIGAQTIGWRPSCTHDAPTVGCLVLDPFAGSGTVGLVSLNYGRRFVGIELNPEYAKMAEKRIAPALAQELLAL